MKYIVFEDSGNEMLVAFPKCIDHNRMAEAMSALRFGSDREWHRRQGKIVAAGFIEGRECVGRSETLNIGSRKNIDTMMFLAGGFRVLTPKT